MKWLSLHLGGQLWGIYLVNPGNHRLVEDGERLLGCTYQDECRIYLARGLSDQVLEDTLLHELLHAALHVSGAALVINSHSKEEAIVRDLTPVLHRLLKDLGYRFPKS